MKYVMFVKEGGESVGLAYPVIFSNHLVHDEVAKALLAGPLEGFTVRSAGELSSLDMGKCVGGKSDTLGVGSHPDDEHIINMQDYGGCII